MKKAIEILFDTSSSMKDNLFQDMRKIDLAKDVLLTDVLPEIKNAESIGIRLFGGSCQMVGQLISIPQGQIDRLRQFIKNEIPEPAGSTPLALAIYTSVDHLSNSNLPEKEIYLLTDGHETCQTEKEVIKAAEYAAQKNIKCKIHIVSLGELSEKAKRQFAIITKLTGGKNINIEKESNSRKEISNQLNDLFEPLTKEISDEIDEEINLQKKSFRHQTIRNILQNIFFKKHNINYIPSSKSNNCQKLVVIEHLENQSGLENLIIGLEHVKHCSGTNKEILLLVTEWDENYHGKLFEYWRNLFVENGVKKFSIKLIGFPGYKEL